MSRRFEISLNDLRFYASIGVFEQEQVIGNEFIVNVKVTYNADGFTCDDDISHTISYADIYDLIKYEMSIPCKLLETKCVMIANKILHKWLNVESGYVKIVKLVPPIAGIDGNCSVTYSFERESQGDENNS